jgi:hypothetical protein
MMSINIRDDYLESQVEIEQARRGDATATKTARDLLRERLIQIGLSPSGVDSAAHD